MSDTDQFTNPIVEVPDTDETSTQVRIEATQDGAATVWINRLHGRRP